MFNQTFLAHDELDIHEASLGPPKQPVLNVCQSMGTCWPVKHLKARDWLDATRMP